MRRWALRLGLLATLLAVLAALMFKRVFVVREIEVAGNENLAPETVIAASGLEPGQGMLRLKIEQVRNGISALGTHALVGLEKCWPDTVRLVLRAREPAAMALCAGGLAVLDAEGVVMGFAEEAPDRDLVYLSGVDAGEAESGETLPVEEERLNLYADLMEALAALDAEAYVSEINLSDPEEIRLILRGGCEAILGDGEMLRDKLAWMKAIVQDMEHRGEIGGRLYISENGHADLSMPQPMEER